MDFRRDDAGMASRVYRQGPGGRESLSFVGPAHTVPGIRGQVL